MKEKKIILLVEDDDGLRADLRDAILEDGMYDVVTQENGYEALGWLSENRPPNLIITDYLMFCKGSDLARAAMRLNVPTIVITGSVDEAIRGLRESRLNIPVVKKPFDIYRLLSLVDVITRSNVSEKYLQSTLSSSDLLGGSPDELSDEAGSQIH